MTPRSSCRLRAAVLLLLLLLLAVLTPLPLLAPVLFAKEPPAAALEWAQWRGPGRDGISSETGMLKEWTEEGPPLLWQAKGLGKGYSSVAIAGGKIFTLGERKGGAQLLALRLEDGSEVWAADVGKGSPNSTPTVDGDLVFALGREGDLLAAESATGKEVWRRSFPKDFGGEMMSGWGYSESLLVDGDRLIATPGAQDAMLAALEKRTGKVIWKAAVPKDLGSRGKDGAGYSSFVVSEASGVRQYIQLTGRGVISVAAEDGKFLWAYNRIANDTANIPTPIVKDDLVFCSSGYGTGAALLKVKREGDRLQCEEVYFLKANEMQNHHGGMVLVGDHVYAGHGHNNGFPVCLELATGKAAWGPERGPGGGSAALLYADGHLYFRYENGIMALVEATPKGYRLKGSFKIASRLGESWPHPVIVDRRLYLRDQDVLLAYDLKG
jgi:outer membrane protein assembly factor BamB